MRVALFAISNFVVAVPMLGDLSFELGEPLGGKEELIAGWQVRGMGQQRAKRHCKCNGEAEN
ncbi:hypothetical protein PZ895_02505 [Mesorhizobium sp. YIM 152430]|uniref:hypothetical protein n=1 Tax=Mesorhizobium sp. YIM 152430 TaxID=3031761 RepID=UPI0023DB8A12|nr:hypothetical protein [Mesorhizobium sp. YIM 152430]MDF1598646.1 hypothetical protein [Mesorhizobium sp. YIM 152430]